jgi:hypothetical protein
VDSSRWTAWLAGLPEKIPTRPSPAWRFHFVIRFGGIIYRADSSARNWSPVKASGAIFALKAAVKFRRFAILCDPPHKGQIPASLRIPMKTATESNLKRPPIPIQSGHIFSGPV